MPCQASSLYAEGVVLLGEEGDVNKAVNRQRGQEGFIMTCGITKEHVRKHSPQSFRPITNTNGIIGRGFGNAV